MARKTNRESGYLQIQRSELANGLNAPPSLMNTYLGPNGTIYEALSFGAGDRVVLRRTPMPALPARLPSVPTMPLDRIAPKETIIQRAPLDWSIVKKATGETRWQHIQKQGVNNLNKDLHGVFDQDAALTTQEAWYRAQRMGINMDADGTLVVPMGRRVGFEGGKLGSGTELNSVTIHTTNGSKIITAYPTK